MLQLKNLKLKIHNHRQIIYCILFICLLIVLNLVYKNLNDTRVREKFEDEKGKPEDFAVLTEVQDLSTYNQKVILNSTNQVNFANSSIGEYFKGVSGGNTLTDIFTDIYTKIGTNTSDINTIKTSITTLTALSNTANSTATLALGTANTALSTANTSNSAAKLALDGVSTMALLPIGSIIAWNSSVLPTVDSNNVQHWAFCNGQLASFVDSVTKQLGTYQTPNLLGRFIFGATTMGNVTDKGSLTSNSSANYTFQSPDPSNRGLGRIGGEEMHQLTVAEMPSHTHGYMGGPRHGGNGTSNDWQWGDMTTTPAGGDQSHNNMPPYYILTYIVKII